MHIDTITLFIVYVNTVFGSINRIEPKGVHVNVPTEIIFLIPHKLFPVMQIQLYSTWMDND